MEVFGEQMVLGHAPLNWPPARNLIEGDEGERIERVRNAALAQGEWAPILMIGSRAIAQSSFTSAGEINSRVSAPLMGGTGALGSGLGGILGGAGIGGTVPARETRREAYATAEWVEYEIHAPGHQIRTVRREVFDLLGGGLRAIGSTGPMASPDVNESRRLDRALALLGQIDILPLANHITMDLVDHLTAKNILANRHRWLSAQHGGGSGPVASPADSGTASPTLGPVHGLALARHVWSRAPGAAYLDRPNVFTYRRHLRAGVDGQLRFVEGLDIVANDVSTMSGSAADRFAVRVEQGVLESNAEAVLALAACRRDGARRECHGADSPAELFQKSLTDGEEWLTVRTRNDSAWREAKYDGETRARVEQQLASGYVVLIARQPVQVNGRTAPGWWTVHPRTGETLAVGSLGWGQGAVDNALTAGLAAYATLSSLYCVLFVGVDQAEDNLAACGYLFGFSMLLAGLGLVFLSLFQVLGI